MSLTVLQYVAQMRARQEQLAMRLGSDIHGMPQELKTILTCSNVMTAICFRAFTQLTSLTDAQLAAAFDDALAQAFPLEPPSSGHDPALG
jgi:hypothetical protein